MLEGLLIFPMSFTKVLESEPDLVTSIKITTVFNEVSMPNLTHILLKLQ